MSLHHNLGPLIRTWGLPTANLPTDDALTPFCQSLLHEALAFLDSLAPKTPVANGGARVTTESWNNSHSVKTLDPCRAPIHLNSRNISAEQLRAVAKENPESHAPPADRVRAENWAARVSVHDDAAERGTATWGEFREAFKDRHAEVEKEFTPSVVGMRTVKEWDCGGVNATEGERSWGEFTLRTVESKHEMPVGVSDRAFAVVQMTAAVTDEGEKEFVVVSVPLRSFDESPDAQFCKEKGVVAGTYAAVERLRRLPAGATEWVMGTASEAGGLLPSWLQAMSVPGQIAKDVPLFLDWADRQREGKAGESTREQDGDAPQGNGAPTEAQTTNG